jgi:hypothetical protein
MNFITALGKKVKKAFVFFWLHLGEKEEASYLFNFISCYIFLSKFIRQFAQNLITQLILIDFFLISE